jgi:dipeptidyl aminopeptidase/acylaminoacyl peptidase
VTVLIALLGSMALSAEPLRDHDLVDEDYFTLRWPGSVGFSPDGAQLVYTVSGWDEATDKRRTNLWVADLASSTSRRLTFDDSSDQAPLWSPDGEWLYFRSGRSLAGREDPPGDGTAQIWRMPSRGGAVQPMTSSPGGVGAYALAQDGQSLFYLRSKDRKVEDAFADLRKSWDTVNYGHGTGSLSELHRLDLVTWRDEVLVDDDRIIRHFAVSPDGRRIAMVTQPDEELIWGEGWSRIDIFDVQTGTLIPLPDVLWRDQAPSPYGWLVGPTWSSDATALAFQIDFDGYPTEVFVAEFGAGGHEKTWRIDRQGTLTPSSLSWRPGSRDLCFLGQDRARIRVQCVNDVSGETQGTVETLTPGDRAVWGYAFSDDGRSLAFVSGSPDRFADVWLRDKRGRERQITHVNPQTATWKLPQLSIVHWTAPDGTRVEGILELPPDHKPGDGPLPLLVELHGGPSWASIYGVKLSYRGHGLYAARGWAVFHPNYRGSTGYGDEFLVQLIGAENDIEVADILSGVDHLIDQGIADPDRMAVMGWSNGGYLANCLITQTDRFKAASSGAGVFDQTLQWAIEDTPGHVINYMTGLPWQVPEKTLAASPLFSAGNIKTPTIIHVGENDPRVPAEHSQALYRALRMYLDVPVELLIYPDQGHGLGTMTAQGAKMAWDRGWFDRYVLGVEEPGAE